MALAVHMHLLIEINAAGSFISVAESIADAGQGGQVIIGQQCMRCYVQAQQARDITYCSYAALYKHELQVRPATTAQATLRLAIQI